MDIIEFLTIHDILWQPILLNDKIPQKFDKSFMPKVDDYKNLSLDEIKKRQKTNTKSIHIAIYTNKINMIDIDHKNALKKYEFLKENPYFLSISKKLPHYFVKIKDFQKDRLGIIGGDILTGQWSYCLRDSKVVNNNNEIQDYSVKRFDIPIITEKSLTDKVVDLKRIVKPDCPFQIWNVIIQNLYNIANSHLFDDPCKYAHDFSNECSKYDKNAIDMINNLKNNNYSAERSLKNLNKHLKIENININIDSNDENEIIESFFESNKNLIFYSKSQLWYKDDIFVWRNKPETVENLVFQWLCNNYPNMPISKKSPMAKAIIKVASEYCRDEYFHQKFLTSTKGKLCYKNGVLDIASRKFYEWDTDEAKNIFTKTSISYDYELCSQEVKKELIDKIFNSIFNGNKELIKEHLTCIIRALSGCTDKYFSVWIGARNSGKGVLTLLYSSCFDGFVGPFDANNLIKVRKTTSDNARNNSWKIPFSIFRLVIGNEMTISHGAYIDGIDIKQIASGGDNVIARKLHCDEVEYKMEGHMLIMVNDISDIKPTDTYENMLYIDMPCAFQFKETELAIRKDPDYNIKDFVIKKEVHLALIDLLLDSYGPADYKIVIKEAEKINEDDNINELEKIRECFNITNIVTDRLTIKEVDDILKNNNLIFTSFNRSRLFEKLNLKKLKTMGKMVYEGIKRREPSTNYDL